MSTLRQAFPMGTPQPNKPKIQATPATTTTNGMAAFNSTGSALLDAYTNLGNLREGDEGTILRLFKDAWDENPLYTARLLFHLRNIRSGMGERRVFQICMRYVAVTAPNVARELIPLVAVYGYFKDFYPAFGGTSVWPEALSFYTYVLTSDHNLSGLAAKYAPREGKAEWNTWGKELYNRVSAAASPYHMDLKEYRQFLVSKTQVVEQAMSSGNWNIAFEHVPSQAMHRYKTAFAKHNPTGFKNYLNAVTRGTKKINSGTLYPYQIYQKADEVGAQQMWDALPDWVKEDILVVLDTSGSMYEWSSSMLAPGLYAGDVASSLAIYLAERNKGPLKGCVVNFSDNPIFVYLKGSLADKKRQLKTTAVGGTTDIEKTIRTVILKAQQLKVQDHEMPKMIVILSDMQFNPVRGIGQSVSNLPAQAMIEKMFRDAGYSTPTIAYWYLKANNNKVDRATRDGMVILSGYSPSAVNDLMGAPNITPIEQLIKVLDRYGEIQLNKYGEIFVK